MGCFRGSEYDLMKGVASLESAWGFLRYIMINTLSSTQRGRASRITDSKAASFTLIFNTWRGQGMGRCIASV